MKTKTKLLTGAALLAGAGAVAAKKYADNKDTVRKPVEITNQQFYLIGGGLASMAAAAYLIQDGHVDGKNIHIFDTGKIYSAKKNIKDLDEYHTLEPYTHRQFGVFDVLTLKTSHDASDPIGFVISSQNEKLLYMTDTGYVSQKNRQYMQNLDYYIIESNHDIEMLMATKRPMFLKNRILNDKGHLNNEYSAHLMCEMIGDNTKEIVLAHLSQEANTK